MHVKSTLYFLLLFLVACSGQTEGENTENKEIDWQPFNKAAFDQAAETEKLVLLEVGANWCHWCHVMDDSTYANEEVQTYLKENFILCREDQDARPDLFAAYRPWGWPAIIVLNENGEELLKLKGYQHRKKFLKKLKNIRKNPVALADSESENTSANYSVNTQNLMDKFKSRIDHKLGGNNSNNRSMRLTGIQHALYYGNTDDSLKRWANLTVDASYLLVDPAWSGVYQYSAKRSWNNQHYEKLLRVQADYIEAYCLYGAAMNSTKAIETAEEILGYCDRFLGNETPLYWNSQNADLVSGVHSGDYYELNEQDRLAKGVPSVDEKIYLKENARICHALTKLWAATGNANYLDRGMQNLDYILENFGNEKGLYKREIGSSDIISFADNRTLLEALIVYYQISRNERYLTTAQQLGFTLIETFDSDKGMKASVGDLAIAPVVVSKDNIDAVLTFNLLGHLTENARFNRFAKQLYAKIDKKALASNQTTLPLLIRAERELENEPYHAQYIADGSRKDLMHGYLKSLLVDRNPYIIFDVLTIGKLSAEDESFYGGFEAGTLFMCTSSYCSAPISNKTDLQTFLADKK